MDAVQQAIGLAPEPILIRAADRRPLVDVADLWRHRELLYFLIWRDVKIRYRQTLFGVTWVVLQPLAALLVFTLLFGRIPQIASVPVPYPVFVFAALWPWTFFASAVTSAAQSLVGNANLLTRVYFPRLILPAAAVGGRLVDFAVGLPVLLALMAIYGVPITARAIVLPGAVLLLVVAALAAGTWLAAITVRYRDLIHALPFVLQIGLFATPILYAPDLVPAHWRWLLLANPMTGVVAAVRSSLLPVPPDVPAMGVAAGLIGLLVVVALSAFRQRERRFADVV